MSNYTSKQELKRQRQLANYIRERNTILLHGTPADLFDFMRRREIPTPSNPETLLMVWHKTITGVASLPHEYRQRSKNWLAAHGFHSLDDGELS